MKLKHKLLNWVVRRGFTSKSESTVNATRRKVPREEYITRRVNLFKLLRDNSKGGSESQLVVLPAAAQQFMSYHVPYPFRQNTDFRYFTGYLDPDAALCLFRNRSEERIVLFVSPQDQRTQLWEGKKPTATEIEQTSGISEVLPLPDLSNFLFDLLKQNSNLFVYYDHIDPPNLEFHAMKMADFLNETKRRLSDASPLIHKLRLFKSKKEMELMQLSCSIASEAFVDVFRECTGAESISERRLAARMEYECVKRGADRLAYPCVVAGGARGNTIHYLKNDHIVHSGELVLMDAGCDVEGYCSDITRTFPIDGHFTEPQRQLYDLLLEVQQHCISLCTSEHSLNEIHRTMCQQLGGALKKLGVVKRSIGTVIDSTVGSQFCPHHVGHYLGMDVHDTSTASRDLKLSRGMCVTIEPGIYIASDSSSVNEEWRGIAMRIEDDVVITGETELVYSGRTDSGFIMRPVMSVVLSSCPKNADDIQSIVSGQ